MYGMRGFGADELERIRSERSQVEAEIKRLQAGGTSRPGGFRPAPPMVAMAAGPPPALAIGPAPSWMPKLILGGAVALVAFMLIPFPKSRR